MLLTVAVSASVIAIPHVARGSGYQHSTTIGDLRGAQLAALRKKVKHVFVIYEENESFDEYFGTFPGADNLLSEEAKSHGLRQYDPIGKQWVTPFRITETDIATPLQSRQVLSAAMNGGHMDQFVASQEAAFRQYGMSTEDAQKIGLLSMAHYDCDTLPYYWKYASNFALFDHVFEAFTGPSTPNALEIIAAQEGISQAVRFPEDKAQPPNRIIGDEIYHDADPAFGPYVPGSHQVPISKGEAKFKTSQTQINQRYATLMLTLTGKDDAEAGNDTDGVREDLQFVARSGRAAIPWGWYQEGYNGPDKPAAEGYVAHHNGPQYFAYLRNNDVFWKNEHSDRDMLRALRSGSLPSSGIFYIKGGNHNSYGWKSANRDPFVRDNTSGDDDHPGVGNSDRQIAQAFVATFVNAIARSRYWKDSAIIIAWDDPGGFYDHAPPKSFERCSDKNACGDGPRVPFMLISPYAHSGVVSETADLSSLVKFANTLFNLPMLASLPDERPYLPNGPRDANTVLGDLTAGFDMDRLSGARLPIPASQAEIDDSIVNTIPAPMSCRSLGLHPQKVPGEDHMPAGFGFRVPGEEAAIIHSNRQY